MRRKKKSKVVERKDQRDDASDYFCERLQFLFHLMLACNTNVHHTIIRAKLDL